MLLTGVYYIPALRNSIISLGQLDENGSHVVIESGVLRIWDHHRRLITKVTRGTNRLYVLNVQVAQPLCLAARRDDEAWQWHKRFGHLHFEALKRLSANEMVRGLPSLDHVEQLCDVCVLTKQRRLPFPHQSSFRAKERLELVHGDLCGPVTRLHREDDATSRARRRSLPLHAVATAVYILNRSPTKALNGKTPYEAWHGRKPAVSHLRVFGCLAFVKELGHIGKLDDRSTPGVFIGYAEGSKAYRILDLGTQRVRTARDVVFDEGRGWAWDKAVDDGSTPTYDDFTVEYIHFEGAGRVGSSSSPSMPTPVLEPPPTPVPRSSATISAAPSSSPTPPQSAIPRTPAPTATPSGTSTPTPARVDHSMAEFATSLSHDEERLDAYHDGEPLRYRTMENLFGDQPVPGLVPRDLEAQLHLACDDGEPRSFAEAERHVAWRAAMQSEMDVVETNHT
ncbi:hypothetical protein U9M48_012053 [Paspalum notatum var. saurae]|uniref:GAG-pre-integrase domain-containing protein n=1 Tax=Paspalum notatum var. saurae TaxID=547442 RepID=A0AAQ3SZ76_PASNO